MAGGDSAIRRAVEGAEDSTIFPIADLDAIVPPINPLDTLIGIAASGRTPYVLAGLSYCRESRGMLTVGVSCVQPSQMRGRTECLIECVVGAEVVTGSTRMKAGTATKMASLPRRVLSFRAMLTVTLDIEHDIDWCDDSYWQNPREPGVCFWVSSTTALDLLT
ncbi:hypothetical protein C0991_006184 [Blastosporella zonata]|nr:hypothetical protein C0991_006184 [Blastosporella zonata]